MRTVSADRRSPASQPCFEALESRALFNAGSPDLAFGTNGSAAFQIPSPGTFDQVVELPGGKLLGVGSFGEGQLLVARYSPNGTLDSSFDTDGWATYPAPETFEPAAAAQLLPDGKVMVLGQDARLLRLGADGTPDATFGQAGFLTPALPTFPAGTRLTGADLALQPDGKIVAGITWSHSFSTQSDYQSMVARFNPDGSLDPTFSGDGVAFVDMAPGTGGAEGVEALNAVGVLTDGQIVLASSTVLNPQGESWAYAALSPTGDARYVHRVKLPMANGPSETGDILPLSSGGFIIAGTARYRPNNQGDMVLARYGADGTLDPTFGNGGYALADFDPNFNLGWAEGRWLAAQGDGRLVVGGRVSQNGESSNAIYTYAAARFSANGVPDATFGQAGRATFATTPNSAPSDMILTSAGLVFSGNSSSGPTLVRLRLNDRATDYRPPTRPPFIPAGRQVLGQPSAVLG
jgi:uncharacterized delta-60 repeat protein